MVNAARLAPVRPGCAREERRPQSVSGPAFVLRKSGFHHISSPSQDVANATPRRTQLTTGDRPRNQSPAGGMTNAMKRLVAGTLFTALLLAAAP
jgi:hypothetical protein